MLNKIITLIIFLLLISSCQTKTHVITEWDGDREIRWHTTDKQE